MDSLIPEYGGNRFNIAGLEDRLQVNISDVRDAHSLRSLVQGQDYLFNLAGQTSHMDSMENPRTDLNRDLGPGWQSVRQQQDGEQQGQTGYS